MPTRIRLQRRGKKGAPFYHLVVADSRAPRDGKFIEKLGIYNPLTRPATIEINFDRCLHWIRIGAQPTDTARAILSYKGVLYKNHLQIGVQKGALTQAEADAKFEKWLKEKEAGIANEIKKAEDQKSLEQKKRLEAEKKVREERDKIIAAKLKAEITGKEESADEGDAKESVEDAAPVEEAQKEVKEEANEVPAAEVKKEEVKEDESKEEEKKEASPVDEEVKEEKPVEEVKEEAAPVDEPKEEEKEQPKEVEGEEEEKKED